MTNIAYNCDDFQFIDKKQLLNLKTKAMHCGAWFKASQRIAIVVFDLTIRVVENIRSAKLTKCLRDLMWKLEDSIKSSFSSNLKEIGLPMVQKLSLTAKKIGYISVGGWVSDYSFALFLAVIHVNNVKIFK